MVVETMMAKNREHRYQTPDDLILDIKCLQRGESPMIAGQKPETLLALAEGELGREQRRARARARNELVELASYVNNRNHMIATMAMLLAVLGDHQPDPLVRRYAELTQFLLKSKERIASFPRGSFTNL